MLSIIKNIIILLVLLATLALGYFIFMSNNGAVNNNDQVVNSIAIESQQFVTLLNELKEVEIDSSIFSDPRFSSLRNHSLPIEPEAVGRDNPFELN